MASYRCPCCGGSFNGRKCRSCLYETFDEEISHRLHVHKGEPLVIREPARRPIPRKDPFGCDRKTVKSRRRFPKWLIWVLVFSLLEPVLGIVVAVVDEISSGLFLREPDLPEPDAAVPETAVEVFSQDGFVLYLDPSGDALIYSVYLENQTDQDVHLSARRIVADGFLSEQSYIWCDSPAGTLRQGELCLDAEDMNLAEVNASGRLDVTFVIYDADSYDDILEASFSIGEGTPSRPQFPVGEILLENEAFVFSSLGYVPDDYSDAFYEGVFLFYLENRTDSTLSFYTEESLLNGENADLALWCELPGNTRTMTRMWLYAAEDLGLEKLDQVTSVQLHLTAYGDGLEDQDLGWVTIDMP